MKLLSRNTIRRRKVRQQNQLYSEFFHSYQFIVLSNNENLPPSKPQAGLPTDNYSQTQREWTTVVRDSMKPSSYAESPIAMNDSFTFSSSPASIIHSCVQDKKAFMKELKDICEDNTHLWGIEFGICWDYTSVSQHNQFLGRITILNFLILSRLWHVLRVLFVPQSFLKRIQSETSFVNIQQFLKISFPSLCTPCSFGGLHVFGPATQQGVLQLRWLPPLLVLSL
ncbi:hypothetical protein G6F46_007150 [Rhizopus delemar]|uniref:Uncharacterized protein n=2 Tax=Rhizopus TaxID=4842 RepID=A0A9P6ZEM1_9FUNG|nr:hypothetical protein G6F36_011416 [Rhizopus arrhizus]KAG1459365.1 hypothetical protein G6F55_004808 [Rhizopus delemar]KAG1496318.1 hypothetical protein G6F54_006553 [Rhizopus delemar]KAG1510860.1 hypothetical protein G6F53_006369 [Rhizopus delemar]KAG1526382.1 hypothetical protein G6F52_002479 [Rhizopus delemar]